MQLVLSWPVRIIVIGLLLFSLFVDGAGYVYRVANHYSLTGSVPGLPPNIGGWQLYFHRGLDLAGGTEMQLQMKDFPPGQDRASVQQREISIIEKRVNSLGVSEPVVQAAGGNNDRIDVQLPSVSADRAQAQIGRRDKLVTTIWVKDASITNGPYPGYKPKITDLTSDMWNSANAGLDQNGAGWVVNFTLSSTGANIFSQLSTTAYNACQQQGCPDQHVTEWLDLTQDDVNNWNDVANQRYQPYDTTYNQGGRLVTDPVIQQPITGGQGQISGPSNAPFTQQSAGDLATLINAGSLPANLDVLSATNVGASLGADSVRRSIAAGLLGLAIVVIFMIGFYRLPGALASLALLCYAGAVFAIFKVVPVTLTLGGLTGFILSVGMAVDANVLIFERFKEEMRAGRTIGAAVEAAVRRAWPAIRDSNTSTLITSIILIFASSGTVRGFAVVLAIGVAISLISSIVITHNLLAIVLNFGWARSQSVLGVTRGRA